MAPTNMRTVFWRTTRVKLDRNEREILKAVDRREWKSLRGLKRERTRYARYAKATMQYGGGRKSRK
jgi:hypothetical protein